MGLDYHDRKELARKCGYSFWFRGRLLHKLVAYPTDHYQANSEEILLSSADKIVTWVELQLAKGMKVVVYLQERNFSHRTSRYKKPHWVKKAEIQPCQQW